MSSCGTASPDTEAAPRVSPDEAQVELSTTTTDESEPATSTTAAATTTTTSVAMPGSSPTSTTSTSDATTTSAATTSTSDDPPEQLPSTPSATLPAGGSSQTFASSIREIDDEIAARFTHSWKAGCPVGVDQLRLVTVSHWNYVGDVATGELVVHADHAEGIVSVFSKLFLARFPIERMELVDAYDGDDDRSMAANNTSAFNCREVAWKPGVWSNHAFGTAIDINPLVNPYVSSSRILPPEGAPSADRSIEALGGLYPGDAATNAFADIGWIWGGTWSSGKDWQHFSASGG